MLGAGGALLRLHGQYLAAAPATAASPPAPPAPVTLPASVSVAPGGVTVTWPDGTTTIARPPGWQG